MPINAGKNWSRDELIQALALYCRIPFGKISMRNSLIIELAKKLGRSPASVSLKLGNFASLDDSIPQKGLTNASSLDREVWSDFFDEETDTMFKNEILHAEQDKSTIIEPDSRESQALRKIRINQHFFRTIILTAYNGKCCITGLDLPELLNASHIIPWATGIHRLNPRNGLCLNALHDRAFDRGLITLDERFTVIVSPLIRDITKSERNIVQQAHGQKITMPERFLPSQLFLEYHRNNIFKER